MPGVRQREYGAYIAKYQRRLFKWAGDQRGAFASYVSRTRLDRTRWGREGRRVIAAFVLVGVTGIELQTSWLQSRILHSIATRLNYRVDAGASSSIRFPEAGPYDRRFGYSRLNVFAASLSAAGYPIESQARISPLLARLSNAGVYPSYREKNQAGLRILERDGEVLFSSRHPERVYGKFEDIPPVVVRTLLFIENRELLNPDLPHRNPAVEWDRLSRAVVALGLNQLFPEVEVVGGSTLATQLEKVRHTPGGITRSASDKFLQMLSASLRAYREGDVTLEVQKQVVCDYLNSIPLAAIPGYGEVTGLGDGLWAWFGADFGEVNRLLAASEDELDESGMRARAQAFRQTLSLLLALNRPSAYLVHSPAALNVKAESYLRLLAKSGMISPKLRDGALTVVPAPSRRVRLVAPPPYSERKAAYALRADLLGLLGVDSLYELDRLDLTVRSTLDLDATSEVATTLRQLREPEYAAKAGILGYPLISSGDPGSVIYSVSIYERSAEGNLLRVHADNHDEPLNIAEGTKLELGSTAKLRTLASYLDIVAGLHREFQILAADELRELGGSRRDRLTRWAADYLAGTEDRSLPSMLEAAMTRKYSASPAEGFFTAGGLHYFSNFDGKDNGRVMSVLEAFQRSVNLVFIRMLRDITDYHMYRAEGVTPAILEDREHPARSIYLRRFADYEGREFMAGFYRELRGKSPGEMLDKLASEVRPAAVRLAVIHRSLRPEAEPAELAEFLRARLENERLTDHEVERLYEQYSQEKFDLADRGYLAKVHPLKLWLAGYLGEHPDATFTDAVTASAYQRQHVYKWLFKTRHKSAQDRRIRIMLEREAFEAIHRQWKRLGFPFDRLVPSYATAIGSSGDTPAALAELMGIILNGGVRRSTVRVHKLEFANGTPYETNFAYHPTPGVPVLDPLVAAVLKRELQGVVQYGTGRRAFNAVTLANGQTVEVGGKTGTGDNRFETYSRGGGVIGSRVINRTATFVFSLGDQLFGTITAFVPGDEAADYRFTSALPVQVFKHLAPVFASLSERSNAAVKTEVSSRVPVAPAFRNKSIDPILSASAEGYERIGGNRFAVVPRKLTLAELLRCPEIART